MFGRKYFASLLEGLKDPDTGEFSSNFKLMTIASAFLCVTIGLILMQPGHPSNQLANNVSATQDLANAPAAATLSTPKQTQPETVARLDTSLFSVGDGFGAARAPREPIRLTQGSVITNDLRSLTTTVLTDFGHVTRHGDRLQELLVQALVQKQSESYIDALLNTAADQGEFAVPVSLRSLGGRLDTPTLLQALKVRAQLN